MPTEMDCEIAVVEGHDTTAAELTNSYNFPKGKRTATIERNEALASFFAAPTTIITPSTHTFILVENAQ